LFHLAVEQAPAGSVLHAVADEGVPIRAIAEVIGRHLNLPVTAIAPEAAAEHFGWLAAVLGRDVPAPSGLTREPLGWQPRRPGTSLPGPSHRVERACAPAIAAHTRLGRWLTGGTWAVPDTARLAGLMDSCNIAAAVNMDGRWGAELEANLDRYDRSYPGRFA